MARKWLHTQTSEELRRTLGWGDPPVFTSREVFSVHLPMIPRRYVPEWQLDMKNRRNIMKNCELAGNPAWRGHVSHFLNGRERLSTTWPVLYPSIAVYSRNLNSISSPFSKFNSGMMTMAG